MVTLWGSIRRIISWKTLYHPKFDSGVPYCWVFMLFWDLHVQFVASQSPLFILLMLICRYQGYISAALVLGGVDLNGPTLHTVYPHGSTDKLPYVTMGK